MTGYLLPLLAVAGLCAFWAVFQVWLWRHDPDARERSTKCEGCNCQRNDTTSSSRAAPGPGNGCQGAR